MGETILYRPARRAYWQALRALSFLCLLLFLASALAPLATAETPAEKYRRLKEELNQTRSSIESYKGNIAQAQQLKTALLEEKALIDEMVLINRQEIDRTQVAMAQKEIEVAEKRTVIYKNDQLLQRRLVAIYKMNTSTVLSRLLSVDNVSDLFVAVDALQRISKHDTDLLNMLNEQRAQLETEQAEIDAMLAQLSAYHEELLQNQAQLAQNIIDTDNSITYQQAQLAAQQAIEGEQYAALLQAQQEMQAITGSMGGSQKGDGSLYVGGVFTWPVPNYFLITCQFGAPDPNGRAHRGMDISGAGVNGADIVACGDGVVIEATRADASYGNYLIVDHGDGVKTLYAHCSSLLASVGETVTKGQTIALVGSTGFSTGPHLHLEVHADGGLANPAGWLR